MAVRKSRKAKRSAPAGPRRKKATAPKGVAARKATAGRKKATGGRAVERRKRERETLRLRAFEPSLTVNDLDQSTRFYTDVLGFIVGDRWTDAGVLKGVMLKAGVCSLGLSQDDGAKGRDRKKGEGVRIWCQTSQDIDALAGRIKAAGGQLTEEPSDQWGMRSLSMDDPDGFHLTIYKK
jgi:catechol 2,3-dioxygenase-like lactoylglutathione lyase family enzyme